MNSLELYIDGASSGNPGPSGVGVVIRRDSAVVRQISQFIGQATNNIAEYTALIVALKACLDLSAEQVRVHTDSQLLYRQLRKEYKVRHPAIISLYNQALELIGRFKDFRIQHIGREYNAEADRLATKAIRAEKNKHADKNPH